MCGSNGPPYDRPAVIRHFDVPADITGAIPADVMRILIRYSIRPADAREFGRLMYTMATV